MSQQHVLGCRFKWQMWYLCFRSQVSHTISLSVKSSNWTLSLSPPSVSFSSNSTSRTLWLVDPWARLAWWDHNAWLMNRREVGNCWFSYGYRRPGCVDEAPCPEPAACRWFQYACPRAIRIVIGCTLASEHRALNHDLQERRMMLTVHHTPGRSSRISSRIPVRWSINQCPPIVSILETFRSEDFFQRCVLSSLVSIDAV